MTMFSTSKQMLMGTVSDLVAFNDAMRASRNLPVHLRTHMNNLDDKSVGWAGGFYRDARKMVSDGDNASVERSEKLLAQIEGKIKFPTAKRVTVDDVVGAFPNIPAYLAGTPLTMRRRVKAQDDAAPLAVIVNLSASFTVKADDLLTRGMAVLAFVRVMSNIRPVELWVGFSSTTKPFSKTAETNRSIYAKVETAPLDLARAGFYFGNPMMLRQILHNCLSFQYPEVPGNLPVCGEGFDEHIKKEFPQYTDILALPGLVGHGIGNPVNWVLDNLKKYGVAAE